MQSSENLAESIARPLDPGAQVEASGSVDYCIDIKNLSKRFVRRSLAGKGGYTTLKTALLKMFSKSPPDVRSTTAVKDLTIRIPRGSSVGIIGRNGSGKSSLLKLITGIYKPDRGAIEVHGRMAALIELGAGFHPDFTGRENLYLGGAMHGLTRREIEQRLPAIMAFAELEDVIDEPVRTYSSGMFMRLGFSLAIHIDPDILIVDEVLAVGDAGFVAKCKEKIAELRSEGKTLLLVSHDLDAVERWCDEVVWLHKGEVMDRGDPRRVIDHYRQFVEKGEEEALIAEERKAHSEIETEAASGVSEPINDPHAPQRWGSREVELTAINIVGSAGEEHRVFHPDDSLEIELRYVQRENVAPPVFGVGISRNDGVLVFGTNTSISRVTVPALSETGRVTCRFERLGLLEGRYTLDVAVHAEDGYPYDYHKNALQFIVRSPVNHVGICLPPFEWSIS